MDLALVALVESARGLVEEKDLGLLNEGAGDGDALLLPARQLAARIAYVGVHARIQLRDEVPRVC